MSSYTLTDADVALLANFAGALNAGRAGLAPAERFGNTSIPAAPGVPSIKWSHADELADLVARASGASSPTAPQPLPPPPPPPYVSGPRLTDAIAALDGSRHDTGPGFSTHALAVAFSLPGPAARRGAVSAYEFRGPPFVRYATISRHPFDFRNAGEGPVAVTGGLTPTFIIGDVGPDAHLGDTVVRLSPGVTYYFNVCNMSPSYNPGRPAAHPIWITEDEVAAIERSGLPSSWPLGYEINWPHA